MKKEAEIIWKLWQFSIIIYWKNLESFKIHIIWTFIKLENILDDENKYLFSIMRGKKDPFEEN